ncbi:ring-hydroxylating oxygenase subunit alpha [Novosphingobium marinum]|uniref:Phenylpropionate dioxygenase-like ring-hydroxylating dioxygenase large terminal subunit n=1 Tax=Novosphingobium marinum TaxID=1514948 RepID=A0A7Y9Y1T6_9SPHN|nr:Rieske 2Fe-2S domain-containing protein [Novosphingobium marinum]NYH97168.1 phenylpropionate dioxygenase-like ring-hydroxylating dioxygenase large terminal subunit [Novosphingobium marinum]GGC44287.1 ring-hydroxylating oxygenase subunit alpha [Novosphingobium marinum]
MNTHPLPSTSPEHGEMHHPSDLPAPSDPHRAPYAVRTPGEGSRGDPLAQLVRPGSIHSALYTDETIFKLELERIFHGGWLYIGHESEIAEPGEYRRRQMGRQPVILVRGQDGQVRVLLNRCRHRGAMVCEQDAGKDKVFRCWYHGWTYANTGELISVSGPEGYGASFALSEHSLTPAARVEQYRGFVFASLNGSVPPVIDFLGGAAKIIDLLIDAAPGGVLSVRAGSNRTTYKGNWKQVGMDGYHPMYVHASVLSTWERHAESGEGLGATHSDNPFGFDSISETRDFGHGHTMLDFRKHRLKHTGKFRAILEKTNGGKEYIEALYAEHEADWADMLIAMAGDPHLGVFPNLQLINNQIRIINPISVDETEVIMFPVLFENASREINALRLRQHESFYGPAGSGSTDDAEIFERVQLGLNASVEPWIDISRGMEREWIDSDGSIVGHITDEVPQRGQMRQWLAMMSPPDAVSEGAH